MIVKVLNGTISDDELNEYQKIIKEKYPDREIKEMIIKIDGDDIDIETHFVEQPSFQRIRRITGYLSTTLDRWNHAKQCEEADRVKHM